MKTRKWYRIPAALCLAAALCFGAVAAFLAGSYYEAQESALACIYTPGQGLRAEQTGDFLAFVPEDAAAGMVFYPGGNVDPRSYAPLARALADRDILTVIVSMPASLAILDTDAARGIPEQFPEISRWYMAGHSLGGYAAAAYLQTAAPDFQGLILLGGYAGADLSDSGLEVLSIYGSRDGVMNRERYQEGLENLPRGYTELVIPGGCHAYFGDYGIQSGDGLPTITREEQTAAAAEAIADFIG